MLDKLLELEEGKVLFDGAAKEVFETVDGYMKSCYLYNENGEDRYYFKYKGFCFKVYMSFVPEKYYGVCRTKDVLPEECIDIEDMIKGIITDDRIRTRKEKLDSINATLQGLKDDGVSPALIRRAVKI